MPSSGEHFLIEKVIREIKHRRKKRIAWDGRSYTEDEFCAAYGTVGKELWQKAPHYASLAAFQSEWGVTAIRSRGYGPEHFEYTDTARRGECGILFPTVLLLFEAHHARGKLDTCRLTPKCLAGQDASTSSLLLGIEHHRGEQVASIYVADMREDGYVHPEFCYMGKQDS